MSGTHGLPSTYRAYGCRCPRCTKASSDLQYRSNEIRRQRLAADPTLAVHGNRSTYINWGCRCRDCSAANARYCRVYKGQRHERAS